MDYKEKLRLAQEALDSGSYDKETIEYIFPELKESEDERIRKWIIDDIRFNMNNEPLLNSEYRKKAERAIDWLEKQGEQKIDDKIKSNFKTGDWITFTRKDGTREVLQVSDIIDGRYYFNHLLQFSWSVKECSEKCHLWTLADARDGDVLQLGVVTAIFQEYIGNGNCKCYCSVCNGEFEIPSQDGADNSYGCHNAIPATKEQSDALMKAMADAGYTFDFEKKELKKLKFRVGDEVITENEESLTITRIDEEGYWSNDLFICGFDDSAEWKIVEPAEWSEEDERCLTNAIYACKQMSDEDYDYSQSYIDAIKWLKSLKQRYTWKPSEEQLKFLQHYADQNNYDGTILTSLYNDLKQLKKSFT